MTDKEKAEAEKYIDSIKPKRLDEKMCLTVSNFFKAVKYGYMCGLERGEKIGRENAEERKETTEKITALEKENAELKEDLQTAISANQQWLKRDTRLEEQIEVKKLEILELKAQIGKMQNVGNCKHAMDCAEFNEKELIYGKLRTCKNCKKWELAE